jgi:hypothetical protein
MAPSPIDNPAPINAAAFTISAPSIAIFPSLCKIPCKFKMNLILILIFSFRQDLQDFPGFHLESLEALSPIL